MRLFSHTAKSKWKKFYLANGTFEELLDRNSRWLARAEELDNDSIVVMLALPFSISMASWMAISTSCILGRDAPCSSTLKNAVSATLHTDSILKAPMKDGSMMLAMSPFRINDLAWERLHIKLNSRYWVKYAHRILNSTKWVPFFCMGKKIKYQLSYCKNGLD